MQAYFDPNKGENGGIAGYFGVDPQTYPAMKPFLRFRAGGWFHNDSASEVVMGYEAAELEQREVGDLTLVPEKNVQLKVVGILERTGTQDDGTIFVPLKTLQRISETDKITTIGIKLKKDAVSKLTAFKEMMTKGGVDWGIMKVAMLELSDFDKLLEELQHIIKC